MQRPQPEPVTLDDILITEELSLRSPRPPNLLSENQALHTLARQLVNQPETMLQSLVDISLNLCSAGTAGVSLLETTPNGEEVFRWNVLAGALAQYVSGTTPRNFSPCGTCLDRGTPVLFSHPERYFTYFQEANTPIVEGLVLPLIADNRALGSIWIMSHDLSRHFDPEDVRVMTSLADFTAAALLLNQRQTHQLLAKNAQLEAEAVERRRAEESARESEARLAVELADAKQLQFISSQLIQEENIDALYEQILEAAIALMRSEMGSMQMLHPDRNELQLLAWKGFDPASAAFWQWVRVDSDSTCGVALKTGERTIVPDVETCEFMAGSGDLNSYRRSGVRAVQTTPLICRNGRVVGMISTHWQEPHQPSERELGLLDVLARQAADLIEQRQAEAVLRESEAKYRSLFDSIDEGICLFERLPLRPDGLRDYRYIAMNPAMQAMFGIPDLSGQSIRDNFPDEVEDWYDDYDGVLETGQPICFERESEPQGMVLEMFVTRVEDGSGKRLIAVMKDVTERKRTEERQAFLLKLNDILQRFVQPNDIKTAAMRLLGEHLGVSRAQYHECDSSGEYYSADGVGYANGLPLLDLKYRIDDFGTFVNEDFAAGRLYRIDDLEVDPRVSAEEREAYRTYQIRAGAGVPLIRGGKLVAILAIHDVHPHPWTDLEMDLIRETAERIWTPLERARAEAALRESEVKYRSLFTSIDEGFNLLEMISDESGHPADFRILETNPAWEQQTGLTDAIGKTLLEIAPNFEQHWLDFYSDVVISGRGRRTEYYTAAVDRWFTVYASRIGGEGSRQVAVVFNDISDRKRTEEQQAFLLKFSDALRAEPDADSVANRAVLLLAEHLHLDRFWLSEVFEQQDISTVGPEYRRPDLPPMSGVFRLSDYPETMRQLATQPMVIHDAANDPRFSDSEKALLAQLHLRALLVMSLREGQHQVIWALAAAMTTPRHWNESERVLLEKVGERAWAAIERARAEATLRELELQRVREQSAREQEQQRAESLAELDRAKTLFFTHVSHEFRTPLTLLLAPLQDALSDVTHPLDPVHRERLELAQHNATRLLKLVNTLLDFSRIEAGRMEAVYEPTDLALFTTELASVFRSAIERAGLQLIVDCLPLPEPVYVDREMWEKIVLNLLSNAFKFTLEGEIAVRLHPAENHQVMLEIQDTGTGIAPEHLPHLFERFYQIRGVQARTHEGSGIGLALVHELIQLHGGAITVSSTVGQGTCFTITLPFGTDHLRSDRLHRVVGDRITATRTQASTAIDATAYVEEAERWLPADSDPPQPPYPPNPPLVREDVRNGGENLLKVPLFKGDLGGSPGLRTESTKSAPRVFLVDDNADMREYLTRILSEHVHVEAFADGASALAAVQERVPDLVLTDVMMPGLDGFELLKALRANPRTREVPIILLSARAGEESVVEGLEAGADDYLIKPFSAQELVSRVKGHLQMAQLRLEALHQERTINRRKDELLSTVSHELNTPLVAILGWTRLLRANPPNQSMLMKALETIERNATLQAKLVQDLLDISRITAGKLRLSLEPVELESVIENAIASIDHLAQAKQINLVWWGVTGQRSDRLAPGNIERVFVQGDRDRLQQIITNLLTNAIKFTPNQGSINVELSVIERHNGSDASIAEISITDTGIGISAEFLPHVFERFRQAQESSSSKGLGLGLAIARHLVELHGGTIRAESAGVGQGATFIVKLPLFKEF